MKKLLVSLALVAAALSVKAANFTQFPLLNGYNVQVPTNSGVFPGYTNQLYTYIHGEIVYSLTNYAGNTNLTFPAAFQSAPISDDANGNVNSNASVTVYLNDTNWVPVAVTNSVGQYYVTNWILANPAYPSYMYPATTNTYNLPNANNTNVVTFIFRRSTTPLNSTLPVLWDGTTTWSFTMTGVGTTPVTLVTNVPSSFLAGATRIGVYSVTNGAAVGAGSHLVNGIWFNQYVP